MAKDIIKTLVVDNFRGPLTFYAFGNINSGNSDIAVSGGANPFVRVGSLTWSEASTQIDPGGSIITDLIMCGKERVENGILYVYAVGHTGRVYKIQVNDPTTYNPDYDNPVLLTTLTLETPTFTRGGFIDFFGATDRLYIGHDKGVTRVDFNGSNEAFVGIVGSWTQSVPRVLRQFIGKLFVGNGSNIAEIDSTGTVTTYTKLAPGFPTGTQVRDMDFSVEGNYLEMVVSRLDLGDITSSTQNTTATANSESFIFKWNGVETGYTTFDYFPSFSLSANTTFQNYQYTFGTNQYGMAIYNPDDNIISYTEIPSINPNAISSSGSLLNFIAPLYYEGVLETDYFAWGHLDFEIGHPIGWWDLFFRNATAPETDIIQVPFQIPVSNAGIGGSSNGYAGNVFSSAKIYFSCLETSSTTTAYRLYKWRPNVSPHAAQSTNILFDAIYQTQRQMFSKRIAVKEVRVYGDPWVADNSFEISFVGSDGEPITNSAKTFATSDSTLVVGEDFAWYNPKIAPTYCLGLRVMNKGTTNHVINKIEIDYVIGGE